jgi:hypothetical protein
MVGAAFVFLAALVVPPGGPGVAQTVAEPAEVVSQTAGGLPWTGDNRSSSISADGRFVTFRGQPEDNEVALRDRVQNTTTAVPLSPAPNGSDHGSISDNGCVVAYTDADPTLLGSGSAYRVMAWDRCNGANMVAGFTLVTLGNGLPRPKPNQDGSVIVWSNGAAIEHATRSGNTYAQGPPMNPTKSAFGPNVAISDDGNLVAFEVSNGTIALLDRRTPGSFETISVGDNGAALTNASDPSISGDGRFVTFTFRFTDTLFGVLVRDRVDVETRAIAAPARFGEISRDGTYVTYTQQEGEIGEVYVARSAGSTPFNPLVTDLVSYRDGDPTLGTGGSASNSAISEHGRWVSFDSYSESMLIPGKPGFENTGTHVYVRQRRPIVTVDSINFGLVGGPTDRQATIRSVGLAGFVITSIDATGDFTVVGDNCPAVLQPDASCVVTVRFGAATNGQKTGTLSVRDDSYPTVPLVGLGRLEGIVDLQIPPVTPTTTLPTAKPGLQISPNPVTFDDVVVGSAAPQRAATVTNTGDVSVTVNGVSLSGPAAGDFSVVGDACTNVSLSVGSSCELQLGFSATQAGSRSATITASGSGSTSASAALRGSGRFDAELTVTPEVAAGGQVVTVVGSGFPPSASVDIVLGNDPAASVTTDAGGGFMLSWLILSGTPQGELLADDVAVAGAYDAEPAPLQVVGTPMRPQATAALSRSGRSIVSR